jgi:hypothetical protein
MAATNKQAFARLDVVKLILGERGAKRDLPSGERSMAVAVRLFNIARPPTKKPLDSDLSTADGWLFMMCLKLARQRAGAYVEDDDNDLIGYATLRADERAADSLRNT